MKRHCSWLWHIAMLLAIITTSLSASAADIVVINGIAYGLNDSNINHQAYVTSAPTKYSGDIVIPGSIYFNNKTYTVVSIGNRAFYQCTELSSVTIPESVTVINDEAFSGCTGLTSVTIPESVNEITFAAFEGCSGITSLTIPQKINKIDSRVFKSCSGMTSITIPESVKTIGHEAFCGCIGLTSVTIPESVTEILYQAFDGCSGLKTITIPQHVKKIGHQAFKECSTLASITIPESVKAIEANTFYGCSSLTSVILPESINKIYESAFEGCTGLSSITIPQSVTEIEAKAFSNCTSLSSVIIPDNLRIISDETFKGCTGLTSISIPESVRKIGTYAFDNCSKLNSITIPQSVQEIGCYAFKDCTSLTSITLPFSITTISAGMFYGCSGLISVNVHESIKEIQNSAFYGCSGLTTLTIPESVTKIEGYAFENCNLHMLKFMTKGTLREYGQLHLNNETEVVCSIVNYVAFCEKCPNPVYPFDSRFCGLKDFTEYVSGIAFNIKDNPYYEDEYPDPTIYADIRPDYPITGNELKNVEISNVNKNNINGLTPSIPYRMQMYYKTGDGIRSVLYKNFRTVNPDLNFESKTTQTSITINSLSAIKDESCSSLELICSAGGIDKKYDGSPISFTDLPPHTQCMIFAIYNSDTPNSSSFSKELYSQDISVSIDKLSKAPNTLALNGEYNVGDATLEKIVWKLNDKVISTNKDIKLLGLAPDTEYPISFDVTTITNSGIRYTKTRKLNTKTEKLELELLQPKSVSEKKTIVAAKTNISEDEPNVGFQWKKYEAPESLPFSEGYAAIYDGQLEGLINNMQQTYYNVRAFYKDATGNYYYSDLKVFDPTDFSYFEPTVHTYPVEADETSATLMGYALEGTDDIINQGFQYWITEDAAKTSSKRYVPASEDDIMSVVAKGQRMTATLTDLRPGTSYTYRAYVETASGMTYGEEYTFVTAGTSATEQIEAAGEVSIVGYYDLSGRRYDEPQQGFNIILYSDGTFQKVVIK